MVNVSFRWIDNVSAGYINQVSLILIGQLGLGHQASGLASRRLEDFENFTPTPEEND